MCARGFAIATMKSLAEIEIIHSDAAWLGLYWQPDFLILFSFSLENLARGAASCTSEFVSMALHKFW